MRGGRKTIGGYPHKRDVGNNIVLSNRGAEAAAATAEVRSGDDAGASASRGCRAVCRARQ